jgi:hypothetical protein
VRVHLGVAGGLVGRGLGVGADLVRLAFGYRDVFLGRALSQGQHLQRVVGVQRAAGHDQRVFRGRAVR